MIFIVTAVAQEHLKGLGGKLDVNFLWEFEDGEEIGRGCKIEKGKDAKIYRKQIRRALKKSKKQRAMAVSALIYYFKFIFVY